MGKLYFFPDKINIAHKDADYVIVATPTNYDPDKNYFDTSSVESSIEAILAVNNDATIIIKSTVPVGYTLELRKNTIQKILFLTQNSYMKIKHYMITYIHQESLLVVR